MTSRPATGAHGSRGQSVVEFALVLPLVAICGLVLVGFAALCLQYVVLQDTARNAVRAAITAYDPSAAATAVAALFGTTSVTEIDDVSHTVTVEVRKQVRIPLPVLDKLIGPRVITATATMLREPPIVLG